MLRSQHSRKHPTRSCFFQSFPSTSTVSIQGSGNHYHACAVDDDFDTDFDQTVTLREEAWWGSRFVISHQLPAPSSQFTSKETGGKGRTCLTDSPANSAWAQNVTRVGSSLLGSAGHIMPSLTPYCLEYHLCSTDVSDWNLANNSVGDAAGTDSNPLSLNGTARICRIIKHGCLEASPLLKDPGPALVPSPRQM